MNNETIYLNELKKRLRLVYSQLKKKELEQIKLKPNNNSLNEDLKEIDDYYNKQLFKLEQIEELEKTNNDNASNQIKQFEAFLIAENTSENEKANLLVTFIALSTRPELNILSLSTEQVYLLSEIMMYVPFKDYGIYGPVMSNLKILQTLMNKTDDLTMRLDLLENIFDYCDNCAYENMEQEDYETMISDSVVMISNIIIKQK